MRRYIILTAAAVMMAVTAAAQVGDYRSEVAVGVNGGYVMSTVGFNPNIQQKTLGGMTGGLSVRYTCEKYFNSICALVGEVNYTQTGWREDILTAEDMPVINQYTGRPEEYERQLTYIQVPMMARMGWGRERKGFQFFFQLGPQVGMFLSEKSKSNFDFNLRNVNDRIGAQRDATQEILPIERKFDYGIVGGLGLEYSHPKVGHFIIEGRYYYGLGDIYNNSKRDYFGRSNIGNIVVKLTYLFDIVKSNNPKIK
ncbi:MAG: PorT family protein [Prevotella sp.]|nr:PorT family protein [Prevotella sp.]